MKISNNVDIYKIDSSLQHQSNTRYLDMNSADTLELSGSHKNVANNNGIISKVQSFGKSLSKYFGKDSDTYYLSEYRGFEEHFFTKGDGIVHDIKLTHKQKKLINKRITDFENYKNTLSPSERAALEKNKHSMLDFCIEDGMPDIDYKGYKKFLAKYEQYKTGDFSGITNEDLAQLLFYTNTKDLVSDKKIGTFAQGRMGDCWFLSMLGNYASTLEGEKNIENRIKGPDKYGNYTVILNNPIDKSKQEEYIVKKKDLQSYDLSDMDSALSSGDLDVRIMEVAMSKMVQKYFFEQSVEMSNPAFEERIKYCANENLFQEFDILDEAEPMYGLFSEGFCEKELLVHKALGYDSNIKTYTTKDSSILDNYRERHNIPKSDAEIYEIEIAVSEENGKLKFSYNINPTQYKDLGEVLFNPDFKSSELICSTSNKSPEDKDESRYISTGHAFNIMSKTNKDGTVVVNDPYNSAFPHAIDREMINNRMRAITYIPR